MDTFVAYLTSPEFSAFMSGPAQILILICMGLAFAALLLELRLPVAAYWGLPNHTLHRLLYALKLQHRPPVWGTTYANKPKKPLELVAVQLLTPTGKHIATTYSDADGHYGFSLTPGRYLVKATKGNYIQPTRLNPENIEIRTLDDAFVIEVAVLNQHVPPVVDIVLSATPAALAANKSWARYARMLIFQLGHALLLLAAALSLMGLWLGLGWFYLAIVVVCLVLLIIKLYLLQMIGILSTTSQENSHA